MTACSTLTGGCRSRMTSSFRMTSPLRSFVGQGRQDDTNITKVGNRHQGEEDDGYDTNFVQHIESNKIGLESSNVSMTFAGSGCTPRSIGGNAPLVSICQCMSTASPHLLLIPQMSKLHCWYEMVKPLHCCYVMVKPLHFCYIMVKSLLRRLSFIKTIR